MDDSNAGVEAIIAICFDLKRKVNKAFFWGQKFSKDSNKESLDQEFSLVEDAAKSNDSGAIEPAMSRFIDLLRAWALLDLYPPVVVCAKWRYLSRLHDLNIPLGCWRFWLECAIVL